MNVEYAIIVKNKTRLETLIERFNTRDQAKFYIERLGGNFEDYVVEHDVFNLAHETVFPSKETSGVHVESHEISGPF